MFSQHYTQARQHFINAAQNVNAEIISHKVSARGVNGEDLYIDVATLGSKNPDQTLLLTSGLHGVEGFFGSAVQRQWLENFKANPIDLGTSAVVLVHALNPYGFAWQRRTNENNVDLNRNFLLSHQSYQGSHPLLQEIPWLQQPASPSNKFFSFELYSIWSILRYGFKNIQGCLQSGQFDYPHGLFWGGHKLEETGQIVREHIDAWTRQAPKIFHIDYHTGLGKYGYCHLLTFGEEEFKQTFWLLGRFATGPNAIYTTLIGGGKPEGSFAHFMSHHFAAAHKKYTYMAAEYGTHSVLQGFKALYHENRFHQHMGPQHDAAKKALMEFFCPTDPKWRKKCLDDSQLTITRALQVIAED